MGGFGGCRWVDWGREGEYGSEIGFVFGVFLDEIEVL